MNTTVYVHGVTWSMEFQDHKFLILLFLSFILSYFILSFGWGTGLAIKKIFEKTAHFTLITVPKTGVSTQPIRSVNMQTKKTLQSKPNNVLLIQKRFDTIFPVKEHCSMILFGVVLFQFHRWKISLYSKFTENMKVRVKCGLIFFNKPKLWHKVVKFKNNLKLSKS